MKTDTPRMKEAWARSSRTSDGRYSTDTPMRVYAESCYEEGCALERELTAARAEISHMVCENGNMYLEIFIARNQRDRMAEAMRQMWPFIEEDNYQNCNTPAFNAAILKYKEALQSLTPKPQIRSASLLHRMV